MDNDRKQPGTANAHTNKHDEVLVVVTGQAREGGRNLHYNTLPHALLVAEVKK